MSALCTHCQDDRTERSTVHTVDIPTTNAPIKDRTKGGKLYEVQSTVGERHKNISFFLNFQILVVGGSYPR